MATRLIEDFYCEAAEGEWKFKSVHRFTEKQKSNSYEKLQFSEETEALQYS